MKLLLTSGGVTNPSIEKALVNLLGKPISESKAIFIPTAVHGQRNSLQMMRRVMTGDGMPPMINMGWKSIDYLELTSLPSAGKETWRDAVRETDAILVWGGDPMFLTYWMRESGFADLLPTLPGNIVYCGMSAGSMVLTPDIGEDFVNWQQPGGGHKTLGLVEFSIFPHLEHPDLHENTMENAVKWAANLSNPAYAIDDATAIQVVDGKIDIVTEGKWTLLKQ